MGWPKGKLHTEEQKNKIREKLKNKKRPPFSVEWKQHLSEAHKGLPNHQLGRHHSDETKKKMSESHRGKPAWNKGKKGKPAWNKGKPAPWAKKEIKQSKEHRNWQKNKRNRLKNAIRKKLGGHTFGEWELLKKQHNFTCPCCKKSEPEIKLSEDHIVPLSRGGSDNIENIQPLCKHCNLVKHTNIIKYY